MRKRLVVSLLLAALLLNSHRAAVAQQSAGIENYEGLSSFINALIDIKTGRRTETALIIQYGDSHTKADFQTGAARQRFQNDFGASSNGVGGVSLYILGVNGMRARQLESWSDRLFRKNVTNYNPDLIILAYGTNEVTDPDWSFDSYKNLFVRIIRRFRKAAPRASILVIGAPDRMVVEGGVWIPARNMPALIEAQRQAAISEGAAFWNASAAMGGEGSISKWFLRGLAQKDRAHLTPTGYAVLADLFYRDFVTTYNEFVLANNQQPKQPESNPSRIVGRSIRFRKPTSESNTPPQ